jgi:hypothetical protein
MIAGVVTSDFTAVQWLASAPGIVYVDRKPVRAAKALILSNIGPEAGKR